MINALIEKINKTPDDYNSWVTLARDVALSGDIKTFRQILMHRSNMGLSGIQLAYDTVLRLALNNKKEIISSLVDSTDNHDPFSGACFLGQAYTSLLDFNLDPGVSFQRQGLRRCLLLSENFPTETLDEAPLTNNIINTFLFEPEEWIGEKKTPTPMLRPLIQTRLHETPEYTCVFFCDSVYFCRYAERFLSTFRQNCSNAPIFIGLINPNEAARTLSTQLADYFSPLNISETYYTGNWLVEYSTAIRFLCANDLIRTFNTPTLFFDADAYFPPESGAILKKIAQFPLSYIDTRLLLPNLTIDASVIGAHPGAESTLFFDVASAYLLAKLTEEGPLWTVDQVALHRAVSFGKKNSFRMKDLCSILPEHVKLPSFFKKDHEILFDARQATRNNTLFDIAGIDKNGKPLFKRKQ